MEYYLLKHPQLKKGDKKCTVYCTVDIPDRIHAVNFRSTDAELIRKAVS